MKAENRGAQFVVVRKELTMKIHDENIERLALSILPGLMLRHNQPGYDDKGAIGEAFRLAEGYYTAPIAQQTLSDSADATSKCLKDLRSLLDGNLPEESIEEIEDIVIRHFG
jgi:hypothetical protein